jgi:hypothetical protein
VGLSVGYYHTSYGNIYVTNNVNVTPNDYSPYCISAPVDSRLPGGGGYPVCGLYDISPAKFGKVNNVVQLAPDRSQVTNTFDATLNARFGNGGLLSGGMSTGRTVTDNCSTPGLPPDAGGTGNAPAQYCHQTIPWSGLTEVKLSGVYPLPWWGIQTSATYQNLPGLARLANYTTTNSLIAPSLGRNLAACGAAAVCNAAVSVGLVPPFTLFEPRGEQVDVRVSKIFQFGKTRIQANADVFNLTNSNDVLSNNNAFGPTWLKPVSIIPGRLFKFGGQITF